MSLLSNCLCFNYYFQTFPVFVVVPFIPPRLYCRWHLCFMCFPRTFHPVLFFERGQKKQKKSSDITFPSTSRLQSISGEVFPCAPNTFFLNFQSRSCRILTDARSRHTTITDLLFYYFWLSRAVAAGRAGIARFRVSDSDTCDAGCITSRRGTFCNAKVKRNLIFSAFCNDLI